MGGIIFVLLLLYGGTCGLEGLPLLVMRKREEWFKASLLCNAVTNPFLNTLLMVLMHFFENQTLLMGITIGLEMVVVVLEAYLYKKMMHESMVKCLFISLIANLISFLVGILFVDTLYFGSGQSGTQDIF